MILTEINRGRGGWGEKHTGLFTIRAVLQMGGEDKEQLNLAVMNLILVIDYSLECYFLCLLL